MLRGIFVLSGAHAYQMIVALVAHVQYFCNASIICKP